MKNAILILGATSSIGRAAAVLWAKRGHDLFLASRDKSEVERIAADLSIRYDVSVQFAEFDITRTNQHAAFMATALRRMGEMEGILLACGYFGDHAKALADFGEAKKIIEVNYTGACSILGVCASILSRQKKGFIAAIGSVAGDRGRQSNYIYGSAKGGLEKFLSGLRNQLHPMGVHVLTVKPGYVDTAMTYGKSRALLVVGPEEVAQAVIKGVDKQKNVIYTPWFWRVIMTLVCLIPEGIFKRLKL